MTLILYLPLEAQENSNNVGKSSIVINPDGSKTITTFGVNEQGKNTKTVTTIKITDFLDGSKLISKNIKVFDLVNKEEVLFKSFVENSIIRATPRDYRKVNSNTPTNASPDGL
jgi:hypothetical protein